MYLTIRLKQYLCKLVIVKLHMYTEQKIRFSQAEFRLQQTEFFSVYMGTSKIERPARDQPKNKK